MGVVVGDVGPFAVGGLDLIPSIGSDVDDFEEGAVLNGTDVGILGAWAGTQVENVAASNVDLYEDLASGGDINGVVGPEYAGAEAFADNAEWRKSATVDDGDWYVEALGGAV